MDEQLNRADAGSVPTPDDTQEHFLATLEALYRPHAAEVDGIAMSLPGFIDAEHGVVRGGGAPSLLYNIGTPGRAPAGPALRLPCLPGKRRQGCSHCRTAAGRPERLHQRGGFIIAPAWRGALSSTVSWCGASTARLGNTATSTPMQMTGATAIKRWRCSAVSPTCCAGTAARKNLPEDAPLNGRIFFEAANAGEPEALEVLHRLCKAVGRPDLQPDRPAGLRGGRHRRRHQPPAPAAPDAERHLRAGNYHRPPLQRGAGPQPAPPGHRPCRFHNEANQVGALLGYRKSC